MAVSSTRGIIIIAAPPAARLALIAALHSRNVRTEFLGRGDHFILDRVNADGASQYRMTGGSHRKIREEIDRWKKQQDEAGVAYDVDFYFDT